MQKKKNIFKSGIIGLMLFVALIGYSTYRIYNSEFVPAEITSINPLYSIKEPIMSDASDNVGANLAYTYHGQYFKEETTMNGFGTQVGEHVMIPVSKDTGRYMPDVTASMLILFVTTVSACFLVTICISDYIKKRLDK